MNYFGSFGKDETEALRILMPVIDGLLDAHQKGDYDAYSMLVADSLKEKVTREGFKKAHEQIQPTLGNLCSKRFLGSLNRNTNPMLLFSAKYEACADDILINITFVNKSVPPKADWIWIE